MGGPCDAAFEGETPDAVGKMGGEHIMSSTDEAHAPMREQMANITEEKKQDWWSWFKGEWDKK